MSAGRHGRLFVLFSILAGMTSHGSAAQKTFDSPETAVQALLAAVRADNLPLFLSIAGPGMSGFWSSGDEVRDAMERDVFAGEARKWEIKTEAASPVTRKLLYVDNRAQPFPAPLVNTGSGWRFDDDAGLAEITARRIRRNEDGIVESIRRFLEAEFIYARSGAGRTGAFASKIRSAPGKHDGLFWSGHGEEDESPLGPPFAGAAYGERLPGEMPRPLFGYYLKILTSQGSQARGGELDYLTSNELRQGFALVAWPAEYGVGGVRSFIVNQSGAVFEKDLGAGTAREAESMPASNLDSSWRRLSHDQ